jgi:hypothetical protein
MMLLAIAFGLSIVIEVAGIDISRPARFLFRGSAAST